MNTGNKGNAAEQPMNQAQGIRRKHRICISAVTLFALSSAMGISYTMTLAGAVTFGLAQLCVTLQAAVVSWIFYAALSFIFLRDPGYELNEGSYSDISWLNVADCNLVVLENDTIACMAFDSAQTESVVKAYAADSSCSSLLKEQRHSITRIKWEAVTAVITQSNETSIEIETNQGLSLLPFVNSGTKEHALNYIRAKLPESVYIVQKEHSNAVTVLALLGGLFTLLTCALLVNSMVFTTIIGGVASLFFPMFLKALYEPNIETFARVNHSLSQAQESNMPPSTSSVVPVTKSF